MRKLVVLLLLVVACREAQAPSTPMAGPSGKPIKDIDQPPLPLPSERVNPQDATTLTSGYFESSACGERKYRRTLQWKSDGSFSASDIPHPCPSECAVQWSVERVGTYKLEGDAIQLTVTNTVDPQNQVGDATPLPSTFLVHDGALTEPGPVTCRYRHVK